MAMDAGNIGGPKPTQYTPVTRKADSPGQAPTPEATALPADRVTVGLTPVADAGDSVAATAAPKAKVVEAKPQVRSGFAPSEVGGAFVVGGVSEETRVDFSQLTGLNGLNSTTLTGLSGTRLATVNPLEPIAPRTSVKGAPLTGLNGLGSTEFYTLSGKTLTLG